MNIPYRIDIAGGWLDQPFVSMFHPGCVITLNIEPTIEFSTRSGMATSTRKKAIEIWGESLPETSHRYLLENARQLFLAENDQPNSKYISGSQDSYGIVLPGVNVLDYDGGFYPTYIYSNNDPEILDWLEKNITLIPLSPRPTMFDVYKGMDVTKEKVERLAQASKKAWMAILQMDIVRLCQCIEESYQAQVAMFPAMETPEIHDLILDCEIVAEHDPIGCKVSGAGGGGYLIVFGGNDLIKGINIKIRRDGKN